MYLLAEMTNKPLNQIRKNKKTVRINYRVCNDMYAERLKFLSEVKDRVGCPQMKDSELIRIIWLMALRNRKDAMDFWVSLANKYLSEISDSVKI